MNQIKTIISGLSSKLTLSNYLVATFFAHALLVQPALDVWTGKNSVQSILFEDVGLVVYLVGSFPLLVVAFNLISAPARRFKVFRLSPSEKRVSKGIYKAAFIFCIPVFFLIDILKLCSLLGYGIFGFIAAPLWLALSWYLSKILSKFD